MKKCSQGEKVRINSRIRRGPYDKLLVWNFGHISVETLRHAVNVHGKLRREHFSVKQIRQPNGIRRLDITFQETGPGLTNRTFESGQGLECNDLKGKTAPAEKGS